MQDRLNYLDRIISTAFFLTVTCLVPCSLLHGYFDFIETKGAVYVCGSALVLFLILIACVKDRSLAALLPGSGLTNRIIGLLGLIILVSTLASSDIRSSLFGLEGWRTGGYMYLSLILITNYLRNRQVRFGQQLWLIAILVNFCIFSISILHGANIDIFGLHQGINQSLTYMYMSTLGQANWVSVYLCITIPLFACLSFDAKNLQSKVIYGLVLVPGTFNIVLCGSDSVWAGLGLAAIFGLPYVMQGVERLRRCLLLTLILEAEVVLVRYLPCFADKRDSLKGLFRHLVSGPWLWIFFTLSLCLLLVTYGAEDFLQDHRTTITLVIEVMFALIILYLLVDAVQSFDEHWGTNRGRTWIYSWKIFQECSWKDKLIGFGPEMLKSAYSDLSRKFGQPILSAHNELLQFLLTTGILGSGLWLLGWASLITEYFRRCIWQGERIAYFLPLAAYLGQSFFNSPMPLNLPWIWLVYLCFRISE